MIRAIIFDFDGVLVESVEIKTRAFAKLFEAAGPHVVAQVVAHHRLHGGISRFEKIKYYHETFLGKPIEENELREWCDRFGALVQEGVLNAPYVPGAKETLEWCLARGFYLFIVSGTPEEEIRMIVQKRGLYHYFTAVLGSPTKKPALLQQIFSVHKLTPGEVLFVGDAPDDYDAAKESGVLFAARNTSELAAFWEKSAVYVVPDLMSFPKDMERLFRL